MIYLVLAVICSTGVAVIFKLTGGRFNLIALLTVNYLMALATAGTRLLMEGPGGSVALDPALLALGGTLGALFIGSFALFSVAIGVAGISLATATMRLSVALPFLASWWVWGEVPTLGQSLGLIIAGAAFVLISKPSAPASSAHTVHVDPPSYRPAKPLFVAGILALLFVVGGTVDTSLKAFEEELAAQSSRPLFLVLVFGTASAIGGSLVLFKGWRGRGWPRRDVLGWGVLLGLVNYLSTEFILLALDVLPGTVVFPANNVAIVGFATVLGVVVWRERISRAKQVGLVLSVLALVLLAF